MTDIDDRAPTAAEIEEFHQDQFFADEEAAAAGMYPRLFNLSAGFLYKQVVHPLRPLPPEYVTLPATMFRGEERPHLDVAVTRWNILWECAQFRRRFFAEDELPEPLRQVAEGGDVNVVFVPRTASRYFEYAPLFHLLPRSTVERFGLPLLSAGQWPYLMQPTPVDHFLPSDFADRLSNAWASTVWRHLVSGSGMSGFSSTDPIRILAHNLDFWVPAVTAAVQEILGDFPVVDAGVRAGPAPLQGGTFLEEVVATSPRVGSDLWRGESEASEVVRSVVDHADATGRLRDILDAVRSHRVKDDFSDRWSFAREDFERKLHSKRSKVKVTFVELTDTIPVQGPETEVIADLVYSDFLALLDPSERQVVVLLNSGVTKLCEIADLMGYKNHSPISKRLARIREKAKAHFDLS
ncbi:sigma-70 family RNA polymerase sigma factor [Streptosporangium sp. NPDC006013]|uniref:sigma-70 family RNA polymerase sigma factor n=1 Tax=Streptosporangium sp. NPDC006013 TaxID=3155596 RepID=UPI0033A08FBE